MDQSIIPPLGKHAITRGRFVQGIAAAGVIAGAGSLPRNALAATSTPLLTGTRFDLEIGAAPVNITGRRATATVVNNTLPAPILRWREGDTGHRQVERHLGWRKRGWSGICSECPPFRIRFMPAIAIPPRSSATWFGSISAFR